MMSENQQPRLTHIDEKGAVRMVDVSDKEATMRRATASAMVRMKPAVLDLLLDGKLPKGDAFAAARIAGIQAAKRTSEWIPLCHCLALDWVEVVISPQPPDRLLIRCSVRTRSKTGAEMEALTGVSASALTIYDLAKAGDREMVIGPIQLEFKDGGRSGTYQRDPSIGS